MSIPLKYPLKSLTYKSPKILAVEYERILAEAVNVKQVFWEEGPELKVNLDTTYDEELEREYLERLKHRENMQNRKNRGLKYYE